MALLVCPNEKLAARRCGITERTYHRWKRAGRIVAERLEYGLDPATLTDDDWMFCQFFQAIEAAKDQAQLSLASCVRRAASRDWRAARWLLETRWPENWNPDHPAFGHVDEPDSDLSVADMGRVVHDQAEGFRQMRRAVDRWLRSMVTQGLTDPAQLPPAMRAQLEHLAPTERSVHARATGEITFWATARASRRRSARAVGMVPSITGTARATRRRGARAYGEITFFGWARARVTREEV